MRQQLTVLQREVESVRADNVKLYEKIRFLQTYPTHNASAMHQQQQRHPADVSVELGGDATIGRYSQAYEQQLDPFHQFGRLERQHRCQRLRPHEKIMLSIVSVLVCVCAICLLSYAWAGGERLCFHVLLWCINAQIIVIVGKSPM